MKKVLVADDEVMIARSIQRTVYDICEQENIEALVYIAVREDELRENIEKNDSDLIFTDNKMPRFSGIEAIKEIRKINAEVPIYMVSSSEAKNEALEAGATGYIEKYIYELSLREVVLKHLK